MRGPSSNIDPGFSMGMAPAGPAASPGPSYSNPPPNLPDRPEPTFPERAAWEPFKGKYQETDPAQQMLHGKHGKRLLIVAALLGLLSKGKALGPFAQAIMGGLEQRRGEAKDTAQRDYTQQYNAWREQMDAQHAQTAFDLQKYGIDMAEHHRVESEDRNQMDEWRRQNEVAVKSEIESLNDSEGWDKWSLGYDRGFAKAVPSGAQPPASLALDERAKLAIIKKNEAPDVPTLQQNYEARGITQNGVLNQQLAQTYLNPDKSVPTTPEQLIRNMDWDEWNRQQKVLLGGRETLKGIPQARILGGTGGGGGGRTATPGGKSTKAPTNFQRGRAGAQKADAKYNEAYNTFLGMTDKATGKPYTKERAAKLANIARRNVMDNIWMEQPGQRQGLQSRFKKYHGPKTKGWD